jgi:hypothetical protein
MGTRWRLVLFARVASALALLFLVVGLLPSSAAANQHRKEIGKYFLVDDTVRISGGALLYDDCTHDGGLIATPPFGPPAVYKLVPTYWVNNPDPKIAPYSSYPVPPTLANESRLFLCYDVKLISGTPPPFSSFCDWAPRDRRAPFEVDDNSDGIRDLLMDVEFSRGPRVCAARGK